MDWNFERVEQKFEPLPVGKYRLRIKEAEKKTSKNGNDMLAITFEISGHNQLIYHNIVFLEDRPELTNRMLTSFFDSFGIEDGGKFNLANWKGKVGGCQTKIDEYQGEEKAKISYFLSKKQQEDLPPWREGVDKKKPELTPIDDEEGLPF